MAELWQYAALSRHAYDESGGDTPDQAYFVPEGFTAVASVSSPNGLFARAYSEAGSGKIIVAVRGTNFEELTDLASDALIALGVDTSGIGPTQVTDLADFSPNS